MSGGAPFRIVVVGRDIALWLTAASLHRALAATGITVRAVELPSRLRPVDVCATLPPIEALHAKLGLDEHALLRATGGVFSLGTNLTDPASVRPTTFLAHGTYGAPIDGHPFFPIWAKARSAGLNAAFEDFCLTAAAARHGRIVLPDEATERFGRIDYAYHLPALPYAAQLKAGAARAGVPVEHAVRCTVERDAENCDIRAVRLDGDRWIAGDLFVDASGTEALLRTGGPNDCFESWNDQLPVRRRLVARAPRFASLPPYAEARPAGSGWATLHPSQLATHVVHGFGEGVTDDDALRNAAQAASTTLVDPVFRPVEPGRRADVWAGNVVAVGEAACILDPIHAPELHALQLGIVHLLSLIPVSARFEAERAEYNRLMVSSFDRIRDFQTATHCLNRGRATPSPELAHKIATFMARGEVAPLEDETFAPDWWRALFVGSGLWPDSLPPAIDRVSPERMKAEFRRILGFVKDQVLRQPTHDAYLDSFCRMEAA